MDTADPGLQRVSTVDALVQAIRRRVLTGELEPGAQLREIELAASFGVGRHSLRAALQALVHEGVLRHEPNRGVFIPRLTRADVEDLFLLRTALEVEAHRILVARKAPLDEASAVVAALESLDSGVAWDEVVELDLRFHRVLIEQVGSARMSRTFASLQAELRLLLAQLGSSQYGGLAEVVEQHRRVLDALATGSSRTATREIRAHLDQGVEDLLKIVDAPAESAA
jgi:DNA-binding GntR family transcriptional regulator